MRPVRAALFAGVAAVAMASSPQIAAAAEPSPHVLTVQLPDGQIEQIQYVGDVPPRVVFAPAGAPMVGLAPVADVFGANPFGAGSPFAALQAMSAQMDREMAGLMHQVEMMAARPSVGAGGLTAASFGNLPAGVTEFRSVSTVTPNGVCTRTVRIIGGDGVRPRMVSDSSGACGGAAQPAEVPAAPVQSERPHTIQVKDQVPLKAAPVYHG